MSIAIYPGSFDPLTLGHVNIIHRSCRVFDKVIVAVAAETYKDCMFSADERLDFVADAIAGLDNCEAAIYDGLTADFAAKCAATVIVRGLRGASDYEYEATIASVNKHLDEGIETVFLNCDSRYAFISSSVIKSLSKAGGSISGLTTPMVESAICAKLSV